MNNTTNPSLCWTDRLVCAKIDIENLVLHYCSSAVQDDPTEKGALLRINLRNKMVKLVSGKY